MQHDEEIASDELDSLLEEAETLKVAGASGGTELRLYVTVDSETLHELERRAAADGIDLGTAVAEVLRVGTHVA